MGTRREGVVRELQVPFALPRVVPVPLPVTAMPSSLTGLCLPRAPSSMSRALGSLRSTDNLPQLLNPSIPATGRSKFSGGCHQFSTLSPTGILRSRTLCQP